MSFFTSLKDRAVISSLKMLPQNHMSRAMGVLAATTIPKVLGTLPVRAFGGVFGVDFDEVKDPLESFSSIQQFFTRSLKDGARPVDAAADAFVSPCDGAWGQAGTITDGTALQVKGRPYSVAQLLRDDQLAASLEGGSYATLYLSPRDYHRFHAPIAGDVVSARHIPGALWPVNHAGVHYVDGLFAVNERITALLRPTAHKNARLVMVAVGATMVGKVHVTFDDLTTNVPGASSTLRDYASDPKPLAKGEEWGRFEFGSTLVLLATRGLVSLDVQAPGTPLKLGARIGTLS
jgi:phosphatidylserine decarboxylase